MSCFALTVRKGSKDRTGYLASYLGFTLSTRHLTFLVESSIPVKFSSHGETITSINSIIALESRLPYPLALSLNNQCQLRLQRRRQGTKSGLSPRPSIASFDLLSPIEGMKAKPRVSMPCPKPARIFPYPLALLLLRISRQ